jgi:TatD DNase family protein
MELIDTHAHLDDAKFKDDLPEVLERARAAGVVRIIAIATTAPSSTDCVKMAETFPLLSASVGLQPNNLTEAAADAWDEVERLAGRPEVVALGETGLDRHWDFTPFGQQEEFFARHVALSRKQRKPLVIHCREAEADVVRMLRADFDRHGPVSGVMHSFTGDLATAQACLDMGLYISFAGMVTYKNAQSLREMAARIPHARILVETDSPYLAPVPVRGRRNEPAFVAHTARLLAGLLEMEPAAFAAQTTRNARSLFQLPS